MRFLLLLVGLVVTLSVIYFVILFWGLGRNLPQFKHVFMTMEKPIVIAPTELDIWSRVGGDDKAVAWLDVYRSKDGQLRALPSSLRPLPQDPPDKNLQNEGVPLREALTPHLRRGLILNVVSNVDRVDEQIFEVLEPLKLSTVLLQSEYDNVMSSIKLKFPLWIYGTSAADRVRWMMFSSLQLAPAATFNGDVYVTPLKVRQLDAFNATILQEIRRRGLLLVIGPLGTAAEVQQAAVFSPDGYFVTSLEAFDALPSRQ